MKFQVVDELTMTEPLDEGEEEEDENGLIESIIVCNKVVTSSKVGLRSGSTTTHQKILGKFWER